MKEHWDMEKLGTFIETCGETAAVIANVLQQSAVAAMVENLSSHDGIMSPAVRVDATREVIYDEMDAFAAQILGEVPEQENPLPRVLVYELMQEARETIVKANKGVECVCDQTDDPQRCLACRLKDCLKALWEPTFEMEEVDGN
ncbi:hypothetical protein GF373_17755 [bacterium]|nr:hypothetical protein [bacterium]